MLSLWKACVIDRRGRARADRPLVNQLFMVLIQNNDTECLMVAKYTWAAINIPSRESLRVGNTDKCMYFYQQHCLKIYLDLFFQMSIYVIEVWVVIPPMRIERLYWRIKVITQNDFVLICSDPYPSNGDKWTQTSPAKCPPTAQPSHRLSHPSMCHVSVFSQLNMRDP